jgi:hypothetical protein
VGTGEVAEWRWRSEGEDGNGAMAAREIVDSDNEIYLTSFKQITVKREKRKQTKHMKQSILLIQPFPLHAENPNAMCGTKNQNPNP